jgi:hypothetical protein
LVAAVCTPFVRACAAFFTLFVAVFIAPRIPFFELEVVPVLFDNFFDNELRVFIGPLLKREIRLLFCGVESGTFLEVRGGEGKEGAADKLFFLLSAFVMLEAKLLISIFIV